MIESKQSDNNNNLLFLNLPIKNSNEDVIGLSAYADNISAAIDKGAQTIAITSSFGMGKSSVIELLKEKRKDKKNEMIFSIPMWTQLTNCSSGNGSLDFHRNFLYQIANQINYKRGSYIVKRLSPNYRLYKLHTNRPINWFFIVLAICFSFIAVLSKLDVIFIQNAFPFLKEWGDTISLASTIVGLIIFSIVIARAEIVFSSGKDEKRVIESDEIIELFYSEILRYRHSISICNNNSFGFIKHNRHYIVVIEDLDRSSNNSAVNTFLRELRKYYIPSAHDSKYKFRNKLSIVVNIKPESALNTTLLNSEVSRANEQINGLYDKIFDFVINIPTINIDDYEAILYSLLQKHQKELESLGFTDIEKNKSIPGMQWIIREPNVELRGIKDRLNRAILLYSSLKDRFPDGGILFEKCAVVAYLTTAFENDFYMTSDDDYQKIVDLGIKNRFIFDDKIQDKYLGECSISYKREVFGLVKAGLIDSNYRVYFYNYPKNSRINTIEENVIQNTLLYGKEYDNLDESVKRVKKTGSDIIDVSLSKLTQLGLELPEIAFRSKELYFSIIERSFDWAIEWMESRDNSIESTERTLSQIIRVLHYDSDRVIFNSSLAEKFIFVWEKIFNEIQLLKLRKQLCNDFPNEITWYKKLFYEPHDIISKDEFDCVSLNDGVRLINIGNEKFGVLMIKRILERYAKSNKTTELKATIEGFLYSTAELFEPEDILPYFLDYMAINNQIDSVLEKKISEYILNDLDSIEGNSIVNGYNRLISETSKSNELSKNTLILIERLGAFGSYNLEVANGLKKNGYFFGSSMIRLSLNQFVDLQDGGTIEAIYNNKEWLKQNPKYFFTLRKRVSESTKDVIEKYLFLFEPDCPIVKEEELMVIDRNIRFDFEFVKKLIPYEIVTESECLYISNYLSSSYRDNNTAFSILMYVASFYQSSARKCFLSLNYNNIQYCRFSRDKRNKVKDRYSDILDLNNPYNKIEFMKITRSLDSAFERDIEDLLYDDPDLVEEYIGTINLVYINSVTSITTRIISEIKPIQAFSIEFNQILFRDKEYYQYIISKVMLEKCFNIETGERGDVLWPEYVSFFKTNEVKQIVDYMGDNKEFIKKLMEERHYNNMDYYSRKKLATVLQTKESLNDIVDNYSDNQVLEYLSQIDGFTDETAATEFLKIVENNAFICKSKDVYDNTYDKLVSPYLKSKYTRLIHRVGF